MKVVNLNTTILIIKYDRLNYKAAIVRQDKKKKQLIQLCAFPKRHTFIVKTQMNYK